MNTVQDFYRLLRSSFPFETTDKQDFFFQMISNYLIEAPSDDVFILKGFAGTGKTSIISVLVSALKSINMQYVLLAPTGRAAKVITGYSRKSAYTIHKKIYYTAKSKSGGIAFTLQKNKAKNTLFIVDESSMIGNNPTESKLYENGSLLDDLLMYVDQGVNCKILFIGDTAQLPPVTADISPALDANTFQLYFHKKVHQIELDEVMRQQQNSGILFNATQLRACLKDYFFEQFQFDVKPFKDIVRLTENYDIQDAIHDSYDRHGTEDTIFIVRSNKRANQYNLQIRSRILNREGEIAVGDHLMVVKNNYFWLKDSTQADFIANGDVVEIAQIYKYYDLYDFRFAKVKIRFVDYPEQASLDTIILLDTLSSESPALTYDESNKLFQNVMADYAEMPQYKKLKNLKENEFYNALQVKFAYAVTCHKSQGGQWKNVFIEQPYTPDGWTHDYVRWLYTALTRAQEKVYLIGFKDDNFI